MIPQEGKQDRIASYSNETYKSFYRDIFNTFAYIVEDTITDDDIDKIIKEDIFQRIKKYIEHILINTEFEINDVHGVMKRKKANSDKWYISLKPTVIEKILNNIGGE